MSKDITTTLLKNNKSYQEQFEKTDITHILNAYQERNFSSYKNTKMKGVKEAYLITHQRPTFSHCRTDTTSTPTQQTPSSTALQGLKKNGVKIISRDTPKLRHTPPLKKSALFERVDSLVLKCVDSLGLATPLRKLTLGYDTEYTAVDSERNMILLSQIWILELDVGFVFVHKKKARLSPNDLLELVLPPLESVLDLRFKRVKRLLHSEDRVSKTIMLANLEVRFVCHFGMAEYSTWDSGFKKLFGKDFKIIRKCPITLFDRGFNHILLPCKLRGWGDRNKHYIKACFSDTYLLYGGASLAKVGGLVGVPKIEVAEADMADFEGFMQREWGRALDYAINDAYVTAKAFGGVKDFNSEVYRLPVAGITASDVSAKAFRQFLKSDKKYKGVYKDIRLSQGNSVNIVLYAMDKAAYLGGLNGVLNGGLHYKAVYDYDFVNCYGMMMSSLLLCDFWEDVEELKVTSKKRVRNIDELSYDMLGVAEVTGEFKPGVTIPYVSVKDDRGLINAMSFKNVTIDLNTLTYCLKNKLFKSYSVSYARYFKPYDDSVKAGALNDFVRGMIEKRNEFKGLRDQHDEGSAEWIDYNHKQELLKLHTNSLYGKFGQGVNSSVSKSSITNPVIAAAITARARIMLAEVINFLVSKGVVVHSYTTDGFTCDRRIDEYMPEILELPMVKFVFGRFKKVMGNPNLNLLELKHFQCDSNVPFTLFLRTRLLLMGEFEAIESSKRYLAKGGIKLPAECKNDIDKALEYCLESIFLHGGLNTQKNFTSVKDVYDKGKDLITRVEFKHLNVETDFKRKMILKGFDDLCYGGLDIKNIPRFESVPYKSVDEAKSFLMAYGRYEASMKRKAKRKDELDKPFATKNFSLAGFKECWHYMFSLSVMSLYKGSDNPIDDVRAYIAVQLKAKGYKEVEIERLLGYKRKNKDDRVAHWVLDNYKRKSADKKPAFKLPFDVCMHFKPYFDMVSPYLFDCVLDYACDIEAQHYSTCEVEDTKEGGYSLGVGILSLLGSLSVSVPRLKTTFVDSVSRVLLDKVLRVDRVSNSNSPP
ncbi:hypothetical protein NHP21005_20170 (plasmid) [Helicobacter sp. NHP21005]|uniref:DNA polymerase domain-containing protein n=1 Tax=Helicobacter felistomachi TaxID=3040201 RepID=UPI002573D5FC|nr:DNA polymerase domain-containing protein [Helicobacter sp. NHP21005]BEG58329.1 hypothetical protein NHP21005_20170 [Helicobacter sp. NHP21005]